MTIDSRWLFTKSYTKCGKINNQFNHLPIIDYFYFIDIELTDVIKPIIDHSRTISLSHMRLSR